MDNLNSSKEKNISIDHINNNKSIYSKAYENKISKKKIIYTNLLIDFKNFIKKGFKEEKKLIIPLFISMGFFILKKRPFFYNIKNNYEISNSLFKRNKRIKVNFIKDNIEKKELNLRFTYSYGYKHINEFKNFLNFSKKIKEENSKSLELIKGIEVNLCGIKNLHEEGKLILLEFLSDKNSKIFLKFNHINYNENPEIYVWLYVKNYKYSFSEINLNIFLMKQGLANLNPIKLHEVFDEKIFYNFSDMLEAERNAKEKGIGIWSKGKVRVLRDSIIQNERFMGYFDRLKANMNMKKWQKNMLNRN